MILPHQFIGMIYLFPKECFCQMGAGYHDGIPVFFVHVKAGYNCCRKGFPECDGFVRIAFDIKPEFRGIQAYQQKNFPAYFKYQGFRAKGERFFHVFLLKAVCTQGFYIHAVKIMIAGGSVP